MLLMLYPLVKHFVQDFKLNVLPILFLMQECPIYFGNLAESAVA